MIAVNPNTGERIKYNPETKSWDPYTPAYTKTAYHQETGERIGLNPDNNKWESILDDRSEIMKGIKRGASQTAALLTEGVPAITKGAINTVAEEIGIKPPLDNQENLEEYQRKVTEANAKNPAAVPSYKDVNDIGTALDYAAGALGETLPSMATTFGGAGIGGIIGRQAIQKAALNAGRKLTEKEINDVIVRSMTAGAVSAGMPQNTSETYLNLLAEGADAPFTSVAVGVLKSGLDIIPELGLAKKVFGPAIAEPVARSMMKRIGVTGLGAAAGEGLTEAAQEGLDIVAEQLIAKNGALSDPESITRLIDSSLKGFIGGGIVGGAVGALPTNRQRPDIDDTILTPGYVDDADIQAAQDQGIKVESLAKLGLDQIQKVKDTLVNKPVVAELPIEQVGSVIQQKKERYKGIKNNKRKDTEFEPGDGEIVVGAPIIDKPSIRQPTRRVQVTDNVKLDQSTVKPQTDFFLPRELRGAKPRYKQAQISFPSDLEKALFITAQDKKSKADSQYRDWIKNTYSMSDAEIKDAGFRVKEGLQTAYQDKPDAEVITAPKYERPKVAKKTKVTARKAEPKTAKPKKVKALYGLTPGDQVSWAGDASGKMYTVTDVSQDGIVRVDTGDPSIVLDGPVEEFTKPKTQRTFLQAYGNLQDDKIVPLQVVGNISAMELTSEQKSNLRDVIDTINDVVKTIVPEADFKPVYLLQDSVDTNPILGLQYLNSIYIALAPEMVAEGRIVESAAHEAWHMLERMKVFSDKQIETLDNNTAFLKNYYDQDKYLNNFDFNELMSSPTMREELRANAFGKFFNDYYRNKQAAVSRVPALFRKPFITALNFFNRMKGKLQAMNMRTPEDVFGAAMTGQRNRQLIDDGIYNLDAARAQRAAEELQDRHQKIEEESAPDYIKEALEASNAKTISAGKTMGFFGRFMSSMVNEASKDPFSAVIYDTIAQRYQTASKYLSRYAEQLGSYSSADKEVRTKLHSLADKLRNAKVKSSVGNDGFLTWESEGKVYKLKDQDLSRKYLEMQTAYGQVLTDRLNLFREAVYKRFDHLIPAEFKGRDLVARDFEKIFEQLPADTSKTDKAELLRVLNVIRDADSMRNKDYVPHMRFGTNGIVVKDMQGETVAFYTVEKGFGRNLYNEYQLNQAVQQIREKYSDKTKYRVIGERDIKDYSNPKNFVPFKMTYNNIRSQLDKRLINLDLLVSMISSKELDPSETTQLANDIYSNILTKGFEKMFDQARDIDGYSKDWDRVQHSYLSGASHYLAKMEFQPKLVQLQTLTGSLQDDVRKAKNLSYLEYNMSPQEDWQNVRTFNFLWTMGGNLSTALLQTVTLPTATLSRLTEYNPNVLQNMQRIGKWTKLAVQFAFESPKDLVSIDNTVAINFGDSDKIVRWIERGLITEEQGIYITELNRIGTLAGLRTEQNLGFTNFETRDLGGKIKEKMTTVAHLLGAPVAMAEQITRFATTMAAFETVSDPKVFARAEKALANDYRWQAMKERDEKSLSNTERLAMFITDEAHAVFGKQGRVEYQRGVGGAFFVPFMTYPHQQLEMIPKMYGRGPDGKRALVVYLSALFLLGGMIALPGAELAKEMLELLEKEITSSEEDFELLLREKIYAKTESPTFAKFITQGIGRSVMGIDVAKRIGLAVPGQNILFTMTGINKDPTSLLGVQGSLMTSAVNAWREYSSDGNAVNVATALTPVAMSNMLKAYQYSQKGVDTRSGTKLVTEEDISAQSIITRAMGVTSDQIATQREKQYYKILTENKDKPAMDKFRSRGQRYAEAMDKARKRGDAVAVKENQEKMRELLDEMYKYGEDNDILIDFRAFNRSVNEAVSQRLDPRTNYKKVRKNYRNDVEHINKVLGTE